MSVRQLAKSALLSTILLALTTGCDSRGGEPVSYDDLGWKANVYSLNEKPFSGTAIQTHSGGETKGVWEFKNGVPHGVVTEFDPDGTKRAETHYRKGKRHGSNTYWDTEGTLIKVQTYADGTETGVEYFGALAESEAKD